MWSWRLGEPPAKTGGVWFHIFLSVCYNPTVIPLLELGLPFDILFKVNSFGHWLVFLFFNLVVQWRISIVSENLVIILFDGSVRNVQVVERITNDFQLKRPRLCFMLYRRAVYLVLFLTEATMTKLPSELDDFDQSYGRQKERDLLLSSRSRSQIFPRGVELFDPERS